MHSAVIGAVSAGSDLSPTEMAQAIDQIMRGEWSEPEIALFLTALHHKGETAAEIAGAARALRQHMTPIRSRHQELLDTCGTGGDGSQTFNISTAAALVIAAAGVPVAKHGNRGMTSRSGSADVLAELGVNIEATLDQSAACLDDLGICFCFAPLFHQSMRHVAQVRRQLGFRTIFNLLGPLCNPAGATRQLLGVGNPNLRPLLATALQQLGTTHALVVCGDDGLDEVTLQGATQCTQITPNHRIEFAWRPETFGLAPVAELTSLRVDGPQQSAAMIRRVLDDEPGPARDVILNAAAGLWVARGGDPQVCAQQAEAAIRTGAARQVLHDLAAQSHR